VVVYAVLICRNYVFGIRIIIDVTSGSAIDDLLISININFISLFKIPRPKHSVSQCITTPVEANWLFIWRDVVSRVRLTVSVK
jgi:hypothetical protein